MTDYDTEQGISLTTKSTNDGSSYAKVIKDNNENYNDMERDLDDQEAFMEDDGMI